MSGWIKIHRKFLDWEWFNKSEAVHLFMYLILKANHKDGQWQGIDIKKGQFVTSYGKISADTGISLQTIRTLLKKFENTNEINIQTTNKYSIVTICKYECYQQENEDTNKQVTNKQQTTNNQLTTNKNDKNNKEIIDSSFDLFWDAYDKKVGRDKCYSIFSKIKPELYETIINQAKQYNKATPDKQFRKHPATWLNGKHWEDEIKTDEPKMIKAFHPIIFD